MKDNTELKRLAEQRSHGQMVCSAKDFLDLFAERDGLLEAGAHLL